ncbi:enhancer of mRNA-decapping protein 4-like isoform X2 [Canna indica]|uniref:Enhancer of mRNA-decapping protein 4-like isoform X2 n=1 Tax=Canna indica TaxID=4628 RepID=A0AAQ3QLU8_9LILI|nr:enhancer of mRNA-decapping protein 4-like isoform X2 [Canna indica]
MDSSAGNPNLFKPPNPKPSAAQPQYSPPPSYPTPSPTYPSPTSQGALAYPPAATPFHHHPFLHFPQDPLHRPGISHPTAGPHFPITSPNPSANPNAGARIMALLNPSSTQLECAVSMPPPTSIPSELTPSTNAAILHPIPSGPTVALTLAQSAPARLPSNKMPRGRLLGGGDRAVYDVDSRLLGEAQPPQLEVTPITKYVSDPGLVLGRQIAVNRTYICYGLKLGAIRVLNINTALRALLKGHSQRVTDMTFFTEDVHLLASASVDGRVYVWKIDEGPDEENKPQITEKTVIALHIAGVGESYHPRICWHSHKQEILFVGIGNHVLKIDIIKLGRGKEFSADAPLKCSVEKLIDGVQLIGKHEGDVTDLSISQWMITRLVSASKDGTVKIWDDRKAAPLATLRPNDGQPVNAVSFMTSPDRPQHINLITAGPLNREVKVWTSTSDEGWLLPSDSESWHCSQTLDLKSSSEPRLEEAFFNQIVVLPRANLIVIANAKKNAIYAVHVDYGFCPAATRMDYIADFTVAMPILSLTGITTNELLPEGEQLVQLFCVQTQAIQQYALDLTQCLPPPTTNFGLAKDAVSHALDTPSSEGLSLLESCTELTVNDPSVVSASPQLQLITSNCGGAPAFLSPSKLAASGITNIREPITSKHEDKASAPPVVKDTDAQHVPSSVPVVNFDLSGRVPILNIPDKGFGKGSSIIDHKIVEVERRADSLVTGSLDTPYIKDSWAKDDSDSVKDDPSTVSNPLSIIKSNGKTTHLITPSEILSGVINSSEISHVNQDLVVDQVVQDMNNNIVNQDKEFYKSAQDFDSQKVAKAVTIEKKERSSHASETKFKGVHECSTAIETCKGNADVAIPQILALQEMLNQVMSMQKEMQKQISLQVAAPVTKEGKRVEIALGRCMERAIKANTDALWPRFLEENVKRDRARKDQMQQTTASITNFMNKDLPSIVERVLKKEISSVGTTIVRTITPVIVSAITESFQRGVGDKAVNQLDKSVFSKLEATVSRQIQTQFQTSGKQVLQDILRSCLEASVVPAFEQSCKAMFDQIDGVFLKGMNEHTAAAQQQLEAAHSPLALTLRETINSASSITQNITTELLDGQRKLLALVASGNTKVANPISIQQGNGPMPGLSEMQVLSLQQVEAPMDPKKELSRLISVHKYEEAFTIALQRSDVSIVSWLCTQVDLHAICYTVPLPLNQGVLLALLQQLACDIGNETSRKLGWMTDVAVQINPADPTIASYVRPIFEQVYNILAHQRSLPAGAGSESPNLRLVMHVINSVLMSCK